MAAGQPKKPFYIMVGIVVAALVAFAVFRSDIFAPKAPTHGTGGGSGPITPDDIRAIAESADNPAGITTVKEYAFVPAAKLPEVKGTSDYAALKDKTVRFALNVWAGWAPIIFANQGFSAGKVWKTPDGEEFRVELVLIDDPVAMRDSYANGQVHIGWATLDMVPLFMEGFVDAGGKPKDSRIMPRIYQQVDFSNGGDGIVVRDFIKTVADLRGRKLVLAQNSPSHYFALNMLVAGGLQPTEVNWVFTNDAFQAAAAFNTDKELAGCVSWAPDIYNLEEVRGNRMLVSTGEANKLIADVWFARADFAKDHPGIIEGLVRGIFDGMTDLKLQANQQTAAGLMAKGYNIPETDALGMLADAHSTNWAENYQFFMNQNNPANFENVWDQAYRLYRKIGSIAHRPVPFDQVMDFSVIAKLGREEKYASQKDEYTVKFAPASALSIQAEDEILTNTSYIHFYPNSWDLEYKVTKTIDGKSVEELYDPNVKPVLKEIARIVGQFGAARVVIEGHSDSSMKGQVPDSLVKTLSQNRANAVKEALARNHELNPNQFAVKGMGWDKPADPNDPMNHAKNRRVEVKVYPAEKQGS